MADARLFEAEYKIMEIIWELEPVNSTRLSKVCEQRLGWKKSTSYNMLRKLADKGVVQNKDAVVTALLKREDALRAESVALMERAFAGNVPLFVATLLNGRKLTTKEAEELKKLIEEAADK